MSWANFINVMIVCLILTFQKAIACDVETSKTFIIPQKVEIHVSERELGKPLAVTLASQNLFMRNITDDEKELDYYIQIFCNKITMEKYMDGVPRPAIEVMNRHRKYFSWWQNGNPFSSYLTFLNQDAAAQFLSEQESHLKSSNALLALYPVEKNPFQQEIFTKYEISLNFLKKEFEESKRIFIGHTLLEPGEDRDLKTDAELSYVFLPAFWGRGYGTEAVGNIIELARLLRQKEIMLESHIIDTLIATALPSNPASCKVLEKNGFAIDKEEEKFGALRRLYVLGL